MKADRDERGKYRPYGTVWTRAKGERRYLLYFSAEVEERTGLEWLYREGLQVVLAVALYVVLLALVFVGWEAALCVSALVAGGLFAWLRDNGNHNAVAVSPHGRRHPFVDDVIERTPGSQPGEHSRRRGSRPHLPSDQHDSEAVAADGRHLGDHQTRGSG